MIYSNPRNDYSFHKIFGANSPKESLISFLNSLLRLKDNKIIIDIEHMTTQMLPEKEDGKTGIVDVLCKDNSGNQYIVEMQVAAEYSFDKRMLFYAARAYTSQSMTGDIYRELKKVMVIAIIDYILFKNHKDYISRFQIKDSEHNNYIDGIEFAFCELPKYNKNLREIETIEDKWLYFFKNADRLKEVPAIMKEDNGIIMAFDMINMSKWTEVDMFKYETLGQDVNRINAVRYQGFLDGKDEGLQKGRKEGTKQGKIEMARKLKIQGISAHVIASASGLTLEEIEKL